MKNRKLTWLVVFLALAVAIGAVLIYTSQQQPVKEARLTVSLNSWIGWAPLYLAQEKGIFQKDGVAVELTRIEDTGARKTTMISGRVDGYATSLDNFQLDASEGVPGKIVMLFDESYGADGIVAKNSIKTIPDLKGKSVAFQPGLPSHFLLLQVLQDNGLTYKDINPVDMDADKAGAAFISGKLDAAVTWEPWLTKASQSGNGHILISTHDKPDVIVDALAFRDEVLTSKKQASAAFVQAWFDALAYWKDHPSESEAIMAKSYNLSVQDFQAQVGGVKFLAKADNLKLLGTAATPGPAFATFDTAGRFWKLTGVIQHDPVAAKGRIDPTLVENSR
jgi:NitT/TauT family transport system substrate-binding protein